MSSNDNKINLKSLFLQIHFIIISSQNIIYKIWKTQFLCNLKNIIIPKQAIIFEDKIGKCGFWTVFKEKFLSSNLCHQIS